MCRKSCVKNIENQLTINEKWNQKLWKNTKNPLNINAKIKARKKDAKRSQNELKGNQNGVQNPSKRDERGATRPPKWPKKLEKRHAEDEAGKKEERILSFGLKAVKMAGGRSGDGGGGDLSTTDSRSEGDQGEPTGRNLTAWWPRWGRRINKKEKLNK